MPSAVSPNPRAAGAEPNYDQDVDDFLRDLPIGRGDNGSPTNIDLPTKDVDEEIKIRKPRKPVPKLDEDLLLSDRGVIALRRQARRLKLKGKGHEFSDIGRLLGMYQLWLDDMFPKAKFRDGMKMVEKLGRGKRVNVTRKGWIDGTKTRVREGSLERTGDEDAGAVAVPVGGERTNDNPFGEDLILEHPFNGGDDVPADDELDALMNETTAPTKSMFPQKNRAVFEDDEDDLDALMAEHDAHHTFSVPHRRQMYSGPLQAGQDGPDEDELDALLAEEPKEASNGRDDHGSMDQLPSAKGQNGDFDDEEEVLASMGW